MLGLPSSRRAATSHRTEAAIASLRFGYLVEALRRVGPDKLLFGSESLWLDRGLALHSGCPLQLSPPTEALMVGGNALRLRRVCRGGLPAAQAQ
jgi:hypothetical protein